MKRPMRDYRASLRHASCPDPAGRRGRFVLHQKNRLIG
ncbi:hypothetical protein OH687_19580 [Burkholderia anthina]|nr:hypothetical protein OH687_19580 [Burkholderia anthina]